VSSSLASSTDSICDNVWGAKFIKSSTLIFRGIFISCGSNDESTGGAPTSGSSVDAADA
jgi:hypothetical protein